MASNTDKTFTITPDAHYAVSDVLVDGGSVGAVTSYTFTNVLANHTIAASFTALPTQTITSSAGAGGSISPSGSVVVDKGTDQAFTITPDVHYAVSDVLVDGASVGAVTSYTFTNVLADHTISVTFCTHNDPPEITSFYPTTPWTMVAGTSQEFSVVADDPDGDTLTYAWEIDGVGAGTNSSSMTYSPTEADVGTRIIKVTVTDGHGGSDSQTWNVTVTTAIPAIARSPAALTPACNEGQDAGQQTFDVWNSGGNTLSYTVSDDAAWLSCSPASGSSTGEHDVITVTYDTDTLAPGTHTATITVADAGASNTPQTVSVTLTVGALPRIGLSPATLVPTCRQGQTAAAQTFEVWNSGVDTLSYTISDDVDWLSCAPASGTSTGEHDPITVTYDTSALAAGTHTATITVADAGAANTPQTIAVTLTVTRKSSSGGGSGCALAAAPAGAAGLAGWLLPYLAAAGLYALSRTRRRRG